jgi:hypothetical protein
MSCINPLLPPYSFEATHGAPFPELLFFVSTFYGITCSLSWIFWTGGIPA